MMTPSPRPALTGPARATAARERRKLASVLAQSMVRPGLETQDNGDNAAFDTRAIAFTKGLEHGPNGMLLTPADYAAFETALTRKGANGAETDADFAVPGTKAKPGAFPFATKLDGAMPDARTWESPLGGLCYVDEGPDPGSVGMPPAPRLGSSELCAEMAEVYAMALVRDMTFDELANPATGLYFKDPAGQKTNFTLSKPHALPDGTSLAAGSTVTVGTLLAALNRFNWFNPQGTPFGGVGAALSTHLSGPEIRRRRRGKNAVVPQTAGTLFRGSAPGVDEGDYLSAFLTMPTVPYGAHDINQHIYPALEGLDYMSNWTAWLDVQNGADLRAAGAILRNKRTPIETGRHLARYVHVDQLYQAYHIAVLVLAQSGFPKSSGFPEHGNHKTRDAFATFGGPHALALFAEVSSRALRAVRRQKFQIHRRGRPERLAALITMAANGGAAALGNAAGSVASMLAELQRDFGPFLDLIDQHNTAQNGPAWTARRKADGKIDVGPEPAGALQIAPGANYLLPMAFAEGSPMHPSYGAGHATVAGACVTVLKAFFQTVDPRAGWTLAPLAGIAAGKPGDYGHFKSKKYAGRSVEGELNKLAANIAIGRDMAGVHYYSD
ncbi:MAG: hypothetical protein KDK12_15750 [Rhodobacteraceae bacterium]|nr:hypothetical protein [Paracoccaceae bacterium]